MPEKNIEYRVAKAEKTIAENQSTLREFIELKAALSERDNSTNDRKDITKKALPWVAGLLVSLFGYTVLDRIDNLEYWKVTHNSNIINTDTVQCGKIETTQLNQKQIAEHVDLEIEIKLIECGTGAGK